MVYPKNNEYLTVYLHTGYTPIKRSPYYKIMCGDIVRWPDFALHFCNFVFIIDV